MMSTPTPEQMARMVRELYEQVNRSNTVNRNSLERIVASKIQDAIAAERERCCGLVCHRCRAGHRVTEVASGQWAHLAELAGGYFDEPCNASAIRAGGEQ